MKFQETLAKVRTSSLVWVTYNRLVCQGITQSSNQGSKCIKYLYYFTDLNYL